MSVRAIATIKQVLETDLETLWSQYSEVGGIDRAYFDEYFGGCSHGYAVVIGHVHELQNPIPLHVMRSDLLLEPPQSWRYLSDDALARIRELGSHPCITAS
jgi:predicted transcriptional regulator